MPAIVFNTKMAEPNSQSEAFYWLWEEPTYFPNWSSLLDLIIITL